MRANNTKETAIGYFCMCACCAIKAIYTKYRKSQNLGFSLCFKQFIYLASKETAA